VELVRARFRDDRDLADRAVLGGVVGHVDAEFLEALDVGDERADLGAVGAVADRDAVDRCVGLVGAAAGEAARRRAAAGLYDAWREAQVIPQLARVEREGLERARVFAVADPGRFSLDQRGAGGDFDGCFHRAELEPDVDAPQILRGELDVLDDELSEPRQPHPKDILTVAQLAKRVLADRIGCGRVRVVARDVFGFHGCARHDGTGAVRDDASKGGEGGLREGGPGSPGGCHGNEKPAEEHTA